MIFSSFVCFAVFSLLHAQHVFSGDRSNIVDTAGQSCNLTTALKKEIASYKPVADKIIGQVVHGRFKGRTWNTLAEFVDKFGSRIAGSENLENAIDFMLEKLKGEGLENVHGEQAPVKHWVRGSESATLLLPRHVNIPILGLGGSIGTPRAGVTAEAIVVRNFDDLHKQASKAKGKIVVYNEEFVSYGKTVRYRDDGATQAAKVGAVASLIRSVTPFSINSPHTGWQDYATNVTKIPTACITIEDAEMLQRMYDRGYKIVLNLKMEARNLASAMSRNTVSEIQGRKKPERVVVVSGHLDSWDVGQGAMDDGGGAFISWNSLVVLKKLGLRPRRTVRAILWTGEEEGLNGAQSYFNNHENERNNFDLLMESDEGTFKPFGLSFVGTNEAACIIQEILKLLKPINATRFVRSSGAGSDIQIWIQKGVPGASLINDNGRYFWFHHTDADMMTVEDSDILDLCTTVWAVTSFVVADISVDLAKQKDYSF